MSHSLLIFCILFILTPENCRSRSSPSHRIIDTKRGDDYVLNCPIERNNQTLPSILQWYRGKNNYSTPIASQFDDFPVHIDDPYLDRYTLIGNSSLRIVNIHLNDNDTYECRLILIDRGLLETKETYSSTLRVNEEPRFLNQSTSLQIAAHYSTVTLLCEVYAVPRATMTWYKVFDEGKRESQLLPVNTHRLTLENVDDRMAGRYKCLAQNRLGSVENQFQLLIRGSIYWRHFPVSQTVKINQSVTLKCEGESSEPLQYQWLKDEAFLSDRTSSDNRMRTYSDGVLTIDFIQPADHGSYVCMISSIPNVTQIRSKPAVITVRYPPLPTRDRPSQNLTFIRGRPGECPCLLDAYPPIQSVSWYRNGKAIRIETKAGAYRINGGYSLAIRSSDTKDRGEYFCRAQNSEGFGRDSQTFYVDIRDPIRFLLKPNASYHVQPGDRLTLPCMVSAQPAATIKWFKNSVEFSASNGNVTLERIDKSDHGFYACQASNRYTTSNTSTLLIVENTTPQAPENIRFEQRSANLFLSWQAGYDGGRSQHFILWYRLISKKKDNWNQILILPGNATEFLLFDLKMRQTYEVTIVGENELGLGTFSSIVTVHMNPSSDLPMDYLYHSNATDSYRPPSPTNLRLFHSGSNLHVIWDHSESSVPITHYVLRWRSTILFNNEGSQRFLVLPYPIHSYLLKEIKQSKYAVQLLAYSNEGTYSAAIESEINIRFHSILAYHGSTSQLVSVLCFLSVLTVAIVCIGLFLAVRSYHRRQSYWTDLESAGKVTCCWCFPSIHYGPGDCSRLNAERHHASLLKANDLRASPLYMSHQRTEPRPPSPGNSAKKAMHDDTAMVSLFQPIAMENELNLTQSDGENRKNITRPPLEAVPELSELDTDHHQRRRSSYVPPLASPVSLAKQSHSTQPGPLLVTFDSDYHSQMATARVDERQVETTTTSTYVPRLHEAPAKNPIFFPALLVALQGIFIILLSWHATYGHEPVAVTHGAPLTSTIRSTTTFPNGTILFVEHQEPAPHRGIADFYAMFQDIHVMIFVGFGFLMTFLKRYGFSAVGYNFLVAAFVLEWALIVRGYMFDFNVTTQSFPIDIERIIVADFVAAAVLISFGAVLGKTNPTQLLVMAFIEVLLQSANEFLGLRRFCAYDIGESMFVHVFGAYFGLAVAFMLYDNHLTDEGAERREKSVYHSDLFAMVGTLFLFCFWPSFNAGVAASGDARLRAVVNTYISISASVLFTYICSCLLNKEKKLDMVHIQNATLAGGVAVGTIADKIIRPGGAMIVGSIAGALSTVGFALIKPVLQKFRAHDTCGVNNLHGMPGLLAGIFGIILAAFPAYSLYEDNLLGTCWQSEGRSYLGQIGYQAATLGSTIAIAVIGGLITGVILRLPLFNDEHPSSYYNDSTHWETPDDFHDASSSATVQSKVEHHVNA